MLLTPRLRNLNEIYPVDLPPPMAVSLLMSETHGNSKLRSAPPTISTDDEYFDYLMFHTEKLSEYS